MGTVDRLSEGGILAERRIFYRVECPKGQLGVQLGTGAMAPTRASVLNISRGGVLLALQEDPVDATGVGHCVVHFRGKDRQIHPAAARGTIRRKGPVGPIVEMAIEFSEPLETL